MPIFLSHTVNILSGLVPLSLVRRFWDQATDVPRLYQTSISPLRVRTSMMVWPRKSSDSRLKCCFTRDLMSSSSSHTRTLMRSVALWHSLQFGRWLCQVGTITITGRKTASAYQVTAHQVFSRAERQFKHEYKFRHTLTLPGPFVSNVWKSILGFKWVCVCEEEFSCPKGMTQDTAWPFRFISVFVSLSVHAITKRGVSQA